MDRATVGTRTRRRRRDTRPPSLHRALDAALGRDDPVQPNAAPDRRGFCSIFFLVSRNQTRRLVLGINAAHDASACLLVGGEIAAAVPEERLSRKKHHRGFPHRAVDYCLRSVEASLDEVRTIVINEPARTDSVPMIRRTMRFSGEIIVNPSHHLLHAHYAITASGMHCPAVLILDGSGYSYGEHFRRGSPLLGPAPPFSEMEECESTYRVNASGEICLVDKRWGLWEASEPLVRFPSLGHMYSAASQYIFGSIDHAGKTMGLAAFGDPSRFPDQIVSCGPTGLTVSTDWMIGLPPRSSTPANLDPVCRDLAAKVQAELERGVLFLCQRLRDATGADDLCISGGVGLNTVVNGRILEETGFRRLFVTPAAGDSGVAIGAAIYGEQHLVGNSPTWARYNDFHGQVYTRDDVAAAIDEFSDLVDVEEVADVCLAAARDVAAGKFTGWFEGASEFGPRALGHRSIVCDPRSAEMRDRLNAEVKFREPFRPYAAAVLGEHAGEYFALDQPDPFMMKVARVVDQKREAIAGVSHVDGTCRIQTVDPDYPGNFRRLIECFYEISGVPLILNTSFNLRGEPIVETPAHALRCFASCNLDVLYLGAYRITKVAADGPSMVHSVPRLNALLSINSLVETREGAALEPRYYYRTRTGYCGELSPYEYSLAMYIDGTRSVGDLEAQFAALGLPGDVLGTVKVLRQRGVVSLARPRHSGRRLNVSRTG